MIKKVSPVIILLLNLLFVQSSFCQNQPNIPAYIRLGFASYCKSFPWEEIYVHSDRNEYISGEVLWFNIYLIDRQKFKPSTNSKLVYFEILNAENRPVIQKRILIDNGFGPGQVILPDTLSSGTYSIRAYTSRMKNFLPYTCFVKDIRVYNSLRPYQYKNLKRSSYLNGTAQDSSPAKTGLIMKVNNLRQDSLEIFVKTDEEFRTRNNNIIYLFIHTHGIINHLSTKNITEEVTRISIPKNSLLNGINQITIFDLKGPVSDRFIYTPFRESPVISLKSTENCEKRSKVSLEIEFGNELSGISGLANLSISVTTETASKEITDLNDYMVLGTEFGLFPEGKADGKIFSELTSEEADSLLMTVKSNWINWKTIFSDDLQSFRYPFENEYHYLSGRLLKSNLQPADADEILLMSIPGKVPGFQYARTDSGGNFSFRLHIDDELKNVIIQPDLEAKHQKIIIESSFSDMYYPANVTVDSVSKPIPSGVSRLRINYLAGKNYGSSFVGERISRVIQPLKFKRFYGTPDFVLQMNDFIKLDSMQEVFFELVPRVELENYNSAYRISIVDPSRNKLNGTPCVMIDGAIIKDMSIVAMLDPELVEKIDIVLEKYRVGGYIFNGIINIISKTGRLSSEILSSDAIRLQYKITEPGFLFESPDYSSPELKNSPVADYRNTLYWNPSVKPDINGKARIDFWSADIKSDYIINIQGITSEGQFVSERKILKVR